MSWQTIIADIQNRGLSQSQIASACNCGQATISELVRGQTGDPRHTLGQALIALSKASDEELRRLREPEVKAA